MCASIICSRYISFYLCYYSKSRVLKIWKWEMFENANGGCTINNNYLWMYEYDDYEKDQNLVKQ